MSEPQKKREQPKRSRAITKGATRNSKERRPAFPWRRLASVCLGCTVLAGVFWGGSRLLEILDRPLEEVSISGRLEHLNRAAITRLVQQRVDAGLMAADLAEIQQLLQQQPWIERVAVRRKWPNLLQIDLVEREPLVRWNQDALMTAEAVIFRPKQNLERYQLPRLVGDEESRSEILRRYRWLSTELKAQGLLIRELKKEPRGAWRVKLARGIGIELGSGGLEEKLARFNGLYKAQLADRLDAIEKIDLRYTHGAAVQWKADPESATDQEQKQNIKRVTS